MRGGGRRGIQNFDEMGFWCEPPVRRNILFAMQMKAGPRGTIFKDPQIYHDAPAAPWWFEGHGKLRGLVGAAHKNTAFLMYPAWNIIWAGKEILGRRDSAVANRARVCWARIYWGSGLGFDFEGICKPGRIYLRRRERRDLKRLRTSRRRATKLSAVSPGVIGCTKKTDCD